MREDLCKEESVILEDDISLTMNVYDKQNCDMHNYVMHY